MKIPEKRCGNCTYWMTQQCPREKAGGKPTMGSIPCTSFLMQWGEAKRIPQPKPFEPRGKNAPMVEWGDPETRTTDGMVKIEGKTITGGYTYVHSYWTGYGYNGFRADGVPGIWKTIEEAKAVAENAVATRAKSKVVDLVAKLQVALYHAGIDRLSISQMPNPLLASAPNESQNEEE